MKRKVTRGLFLFLSIGLQSSLFAQVIVDCRYNFQIVEARSNYATWSSSVCNMQGSSFPYALTLGTVTGATALVQNPQTTLNEALTATNLVTNKGDFYQYNIDVASFVSNYDLTENFEYTIYFQAKGIQAAGGPTAVLLQYSSTNNNGGGNQFYDAAQVPLVYNNQNNGWQEFHFTVPVFGTEWGMPSIRIIPLGATSNNSSFSLDNFEVRLSSQVTWLDVEAGFNHSLGLTSTGSVYAWGNGTEGQIGNGNHINADNPVFVDNFAGQGYLQVTAGGYHSVALSNTGAILAWGENTYGQLGNGTTIDSYVPVSPLNPNNLTWENISAGYLHTLAIQKTGGSPNVGALWAWGSNAYGQLGDGTQTDRHAPVLITHPGVPSSWQMISAGERHSLAIAADGSLWAWGTNALGQLGTGNTAASSIPIAVMVGTKWLTCSAGGIHSLAIRSDGTLWAWGSSMNGQVGNNSLSSAVLSPVKISSATDFTSVSAGLDFSFAIDKNGALWGWGDNNVGQISSPAGSGVAIVKVPTKINGGVNGCTTLSSFWYKVSAGSDFALGFTFDTNEEQLIWTGSHSFGQTGAGDSTATNAYFTCYEANENPDRLTAPPTNSLKTNEGDLKVFPNPSNGTINIAYQVSREGMTTVCKIYDFSGKLVTVLDERNLSVGTQTLSIQPQDYGMSSGVYLLTIEKDGNRESRKIQIIE